jgi:hypothetical protein
MDNQDAFETLLRAAIENPDQTVVAKLRLNGRVIVTIALSVMDVEEVDETTPPTDLSKYN